MRLVEKRRRIYRSDSGHVSRGSPRPIIRSHGPKWLASRHARRANCDAVMGAIIQPGAPPEGKGTTRLTRSYMGSGYVLVVPARRTEVRRLEDVKDGKVGVEHAYWPHYVLSQ